MAHMGAVAAAVGGARRRGTNRRKLYEDPLMHFKNQRDKTSQLGRMDELDQIIKQKQEEGFFSLEGISKETLKKEVRVEELMVHVNARIERSERYARFFSVSIFFVIYIIALYMQRTPSTAFKIENSFQRALLQSLPVGEEGAQFLSGEGDMYGWLQDKLLSQMFTDPSCGDGICDRDLGEHEGFGRFGCIDDCGRYLKTSQLYIQMEDWVDSTKTNLAADETADSFYEIDLTKMRRDKTPNFKFNVFSETMGEFIFEQDMPCNQSYLVDVPDGKFTLHLYQTQKMSQQIDSSDIFKQIYVEPSTLPERTATADFAYGDKREAISTQAILMSQINQYCWGGLLDLAVPAEYAAFLKCLFHPAADTYLRVMGSYGVTGVVSTSNGTKGRSTLVEVPYCGIVKDGNVGLRKNSNKQEVLAAAMTCPASRRSIVQDDRRDPATGLDMSTSSVEKRKVFRELQEQHLARLRESPDKATQVAADASRHMRAKAAVFFPDIKLDRVMPAFDQSLKKRIEDQHERPNGVSEATERYIKALGWVAEELDERSSSSPGLDLQRRGLFAPQSRNYGQQCELNIDCNATSYSDPMLEVGSQKGLFCASSGNCDKCSFCQWDAIDAKEKVCPVDQCPQSGSMPACIDAGKLTSNWLCKDKFDFELWKHHAKGSTVSVAGELPTQMVYATPFNRLVGPIMVSQKRRKIKMCDTVFNPTVIEFANATGCQSTTEWDEAPYGLDPVFVATSSIYNGKTPPEVHYTDSERINKTTEVKVTGGGRQMITVPSTPLGFFPHGYDRETGGMKAPDQIWPNEDKTFKLYVDNRVSATRATEMLTYMQDGGFIDANTHEVFIEMITFNPNLNHFCFLRFNFNWKTGGNINWDWFIQSVYVDIYSGTAGIIQFIVEVIVIIMLALNCISQARDVLRAVRTFSFWSHVGDVGNAFDLTHIGIMWVAWCYWAYHYDLMQNFTMKVDYPILQDPGSPARFFATNSTHEIEYLQFKRQVQIAANSLESYSAITSCCIVIFILRLVKGLDFQEQLGLITRTISTCAYELLHFFFLFIIVFMGYVCTGSVLFGHQVADMATLSKAAVFLYFQIVAFDDSQFWTQFSHATPYWAFSLYIWSFMFVVWLILFNILLAILIEGYVEVKGASAEARGVHTDIYDLFVHWCKSWMLPKKIFMSDSRLLECLELQKAGMPSTAQLRMALVASISAGKTVLLDNGIQVDEETMLQLVRPPDAEEITLKAKTMSYLSLKKPDEMAPNLAGPVYQDEDEETLVHDLMERYGDRPEDFDDQDSEVIDHLNIEQLVQTLATFRRSQINMHVVQKLEWQLSRLCHEILPADEAKEIDKAAMKPRHVPLKGGVVQVMIVEARNLPKMDLLRSIDPYVLVFCASNIDGANTTGAVSFKTETKKKNRNPVWDEECEIPLVGSVNMLTATIFDADDMSSDDLVGCVHVHLLDLDPGVEVDDWYDVINPKMNPDKLKNAQIHLKITYLPMIDGRLVTNIDELIGGEGGGKSRVGSFEADPVADGPRQAAMI